MVAVITDIGVSVPEAIWDVVVVEVSTEDCDVSSDITLGKPVFCPGKAAVDRQAVDQMECGRPVTWVCYRFVCSGCHPDFANLPTGEKGCLQRHLQVGEGVFPAYPCVLPICIVIDIQNRRYRWAVELVGSHIYYR